MESWTVYKSNPIDQLDPPRRAEYFQLGLLPSVVDGALTCKVMQTHGYWDELRQEPVLNTKVLDSEPDLSLADATALVQQQLQYLSKTGFIHLFTIDRSSPGGYVQSVLDGDGMDTALYHPPQ